MNTASFNFNAINNLINNIDSEKIGFYFSFLLHSIFLFFIIGFPNLFKSPPVDIPAIIPIEIINVAEITSIPKEIKEIEEPKKIEVKEKIETEKENIKPKKIEIEKKIQTIEKEEKKFNNVENINTTKVEPKIKPQKDSEIKKVIETKINKKEIVKVQDEKKIETIEKEIVESLPVKKIKPKIKPKPTNIQNVEETDFQMKVKSKPKPQFDISSMLKDLRNDATLNRAKKNVEENNKNEEVQKNSPEEKNAQLSISEIDLLIKQLSSCWTAPAGAKIENWMIVKISASIRQDRMVIKDTVRIVDTNISKSNPFYGPITESAMRTLLNPECSPLMLPKDKYNIWKDFKINFDLRLMRGN